MQQALQYLPTNGLPSLVKQLKDLQLEVHKPPKETWDNTDIVVTNGSQDGLCKALEMLMNVGSTVLVEEYVYSGTLAIINPYEPRYQVVKCDMDGMRPDSLREILSQWSTDKLDEDETAPKFLYINPVGEEH